MNTASRVALVAQAAMPIFDEVFTKACCLNGTRCFIEALRVLVDTAAGQMNRPAHDILVPPFFAAEWNGKKTRQYDLPGGGLIEYAPRKYDTSYLKMPGYSLHVENQEIVARIVQAARESIDGC